MPAKTVTTLGPLLAEFTEEFVRHTRGELAGQLVELRPFQRAILDGLFELNDAGLWKHRQGLVILPRKSGKSLLLSGVATYALFGSGEPGCEVYCVAASKDQARIVFQNIKDCVEADPDLSGVAEVYKDAIAVPSTGAVCRVLSSDGSLAHGLSPVLTVVDETWCHPTAELYEALLSGSGARRQSLLVHITTAGVGERTPLANLVEYDRRVQAGEVDDDTWWSWWKPPPPDADYQDPATWAVAHPAYGDWVTEEYLTSQLKQLPAPEFRRLHLAAWITNRDVWLEPHQLDLIQTCDPLTADDHPVLAVDGSWSSDASAVVAATADGRVELLHIQEKPIDGPENYRISVNDLLAAVVEHAERLMVRCIMYDRYLIGPAIQGLGEEHGLPVVEFPQNARRMVPATKRFADAILEGDLRIVANQNAPHLMRHIANCRLKTDRLGSRVVKSHTGSSRKIDAAVCGIMALDSANEIPVVIPPTPRIY
tara:strand:+ start:255 stop:1700 length:1446 start_codon:yes stop_codon:yes gene_type:complete